MQEVFTVFYRLSCEMTIMTILTFYHPLHSSPMLIGHLETVQNYKIPALSVLHVFYTFSFFNIFYKKHV